MKNFLNKNKKACPSTRRGFTRTLSNAKVSGFTLIEMMIAVALFTILSLIIIGAILSVNSAHKKVSGMATIMNNLNFVMDDMVFNMRTGIGYVFYPTTFFLNSLPDYFSASLSVPNSPSDCQNGYTVGLTSAYGTTIVYAIAVDPSLNSTVGRIYKSEDGNNFYALSPKEIEIDFAKSGFTVAGTGTGITFDGKQPFIAIRLSGKIKYKDIESPFRVQTTVSQRQIDS